MSTLRIDAAVPGLADDPGTAATRAEELGFDGVWTTESDNDALLPHPVIADRTTEIRHGTRIALAFTRSPMALAYAAWDLAQYSDGRFVLGLGTQVKGHNERRFSVDWESPGPRLREVVESLQHIFEAFQNESGLDYEGDHYSFSLLPEEFNPGPIDHPDVPIHIAGVNEYNIRLAGERCDGLAMHPFNTPAYTDDVVAPTVAEGAARADRSLEDIALSASPLVVTGENPEERERSREEVRRRIAFYGSTRTYHDVLEHHGWKAVGEELHDLSTDGRWEEMPELVTDEMVSTIAIEAPPEELLAAARDAYGGIADRMVLPLEHGAAFLNE